VRVEGVYPLPHEGLELLAIGKLAIHRRIACREAIRIGGLKLGPPASACGKPVLLAQVVVELDQKILIDTWLRY
jgi:hypothetical protein